jgi:hypothetical protein
MTSSAHDSKDWQDMLAVLDLGRPAAKRSATRAQGKPLLTCGVV